jgi:hypothetical protein
MIIGLDFDNTIVSYDSLFHKISVEQNLINESFEINKIKIRDYLRSVNKEDAWTEMQGYVYGKRMKEAEPFPYIKDFFLKVIDLGHKIFIISHKTKYPFLGEKYDLHEAAKNWIKKNLVKDGISEFTIQNCYFEPTKDDKVKKIKEMNCDFYVDDLPEILENKYFPDNCNKILFDPENNYEENSYKNITIKKSWDQIINEINFSN